MFEKVFWLATRVVAWVEPPFVLLFNKSERETTEFEVKEELKNGENPVSNEMDEALRRMLGFKEKQ